MSISLTGPYDSHPTDYIFSIPEDSAFSKMLSCIPLVGRFFNEEASIMRRLEYVNSAPHAVELIDIKNQFMGTTIVRSLLSIAILAAAIAVTILNPAFSYAAVSALGSLALTFAVFIGTESYGIYRNNQIKREIQDTGIRQEMRIW